MTFNALGPAAAGLLNHLSVIPFIRHPIYGFICNAIYGFICNAIYGFVCNAIYGKGDQGDGMIWVGLSSSSSGKGHRM